MARDPSWLVAEVPVVTPAGTTIASPQSTTILTGWLYINTVRYRFPPGPMGALGFYLVTGKDQIIPFPPSQPWIVGEDEEFVVNYQGQAGSGLTCITANVGTYQHELLLTVQYYDIATIQDGSTPAQFSTTLLSSELLNTPADQVPGVQDLFQVNEGFEGN